MEKSFSGLHRRESKLQTQIAEDRELIQYLQNELVENQKKLTRVQKVLTEKTFMRQNELFDVMQNYGPKNCLKYLTKRELGQCLRKESRRNKFLDRLGITYFAAASELVRRIEKGRDIKTNKLHEKAHLAEKVLI